MSNYLIINAKSVSNHWWMFFKIINLYNNRPALNPDQCMNAKLGMCCVSTLQYPSFHVLVEILYSAARSFSFLTMSVEFFNVRNTILLHSL